MLQNAYFLAKIGADTAENEQHFAEICQKLTTTLLRRRRGEARLERGQEVELRLLGHGPPRSHDVHPFHHPRPTLVVASNLQNLQNLNFANF